LGGSGPGTTPDSARFGPPNKPAIEEVDFEHQQIIKWLADATVKWKVAGHAEGYWLQRKMNASALWGPMVWVDHDETLSLQEGTMGNYITGVKYDWRVKAVNVPVALVSDWSDTFTKAIPFDDEAPDEVVGVNARRLYLGGFQKGERIRVQWKRPALALMSQQIERYQVFRLIGTEAEATAYATTINTTLEPAYDEMNNFQGTRFIDDDVEPLPAASVVGFHYTGGDYNGGASENDKKTATYPAGTILGTLNGNLTFVTTPAPYEGTYSIRIPDLGSYLSFGNDGNVFNSAEGQIEFWGYFTTLGFNDSTIFRAYVDANNYFQIRYYFSRIYVEHCGNGNYEIGQIYSASHPMTINQWIGGKARWKTSTNTLEVWALSGSAPDTDWRDEGPTNMTTFTSEPTDLTYGTVANFGDLFYLDNIDLYDTLEAPAGGGAGAQQYYHYWVRSIDVTGLKSDVTMVDSYDSVSFEPPPAPTGLDITQNAIDRWWWTRYTMLVTWTAEPEAVYYRVAMRVKGPGRENFGPWLKSAFLDESRITEVDDDDSFGVPKYTVPFTVSKDTTIEYKVSAGNKAGENWSSVREEIINNDDDPPSAITTLAGECYGFNIFGIKLWFNVWLNWDDHPWYEGITNYEIFYYNAGTWETKGSIKPTLINGKKTRFWIPVLPGVAGTKKFKVIATDGADNTSESNIVEIPWQAWWDWRDRGN
jgi:hypothetical protein